MLRISCTENRPMESQQRSRVLELPAKVRYTIWQNLNWTDQKTLRLLCKSTKQDIELFVGINLLIDVPKQNPGPVHKVLSFIGYNSVNTDPDENIRKWLDTVKIKSAHLKQFNGFSVDSCKLLLPIFNKLESLEITVNNIDTKCGIQMAKDLLMIPALKRLKVYFQFDEPYSSRGHQLLCNLRQLNYFLFRSLSSQKSLKTLQIYLLSFDVMTDLLPTMLQWNLPEPVLPFSLKLHHLSLTSRMLSPYELDCWERLLDGQDQLITLELLIDSLLLTTYAPAIRKSAQTLRRLVIERDASSQYDDIFLDFSNLTSSILECLKIVDRSSIPGFRISSAGFESLEMSLLKHLDLYKVHLSLEQLTTIFLDTNSIEELTLSFWSTTAEYSSLDFSISTSIHVAALITIKLAGRPMKIISVEDYALISAPFPLQSTITEAFVSCAVQYDFSFKVAPVFRNSNITRNFAQIKFTCL